MKDKKGDELKSEESKTKLSALKTTSNITSIVKDFFHNPPASKVPSFHRVSLSIFWNHHILVSHW